MAVSCGWFQVRETPLHRPDKIVVARDDVPYPYTHTRQHMYWSANVNFDPTTLVDIVFTVRLKRNLFQSCLQSSYHAIGGLFQVQLYPGL